MIGIASPEFWEGGNDLGLEGFEIGEAGDGCASILKEPAGRTPPQEQVSIN